MADRDPPFQTRLEKLSPKMMLTAQHVDSSTRKRQVILVKKASMTLHVIRMLNNPPNVLKKAFIKKIMVFITPKIRNLGVPAQSSAHSGPGFGLRAQICSRTRWSNRKSATPRAHSHLSGNPKFDKVMKVIKCASPRTGTPPPFRLALMSYVWFWMVSGWFMRSGWTARA